MKRVWFLCALALGVSSFSSCEKRTAYFAQFLPDSFDDIERGDTLRPDDEEAEPAAAIKPEPNIAPEPEEKPPTSHAKPGFFAKLFGGPSSSSADESEEEPSAQEEEPSAQEEEPSVQEEEPVASKEPEVEPAPVAKQKPNIAPDPDVRPPTSHAGQGFFAKLLSGFSGSSVDEGEEPAADEEPDAPASPRVVMAPPAQAPRQRVPRVKHKQRPPQRATTPRARALRHQALRAKKAVYDVDSARRAYHQGLVAFNQGNKDRAHEMFLLACSGGYFSACNRFGFVQMSKGNVDGARNYFKVACQNSVARGCNNLGWAYEQVSQFALAKLYYSQACAKSHEQGCQNYLRLRSLLKAKPYLK